MGALDIRGMVEVVQLLAEAEEVGGCRFTRRMLQAQRRRSIPANGPCRARLPEKVTAAWRLSQRPSNLPFV
jgi:hypothetical protein